MDVPFEHAFVLLKTEKQRKLRLVDGKTPFLRFCSQLQVSPDYAMAKRTAQYLRIATSCDLRTEELQFPFSIRVGPLESYVLDLQHGLLRSETAPLPSVSVKYTGDEPLKGRSRSAIVDPGPCERWNIYKGRLTEEMISRSWDTTLAATRAVHDLFERGGLNQSTSVKRRIYTPLERAVSMAVIDSQSAGAIYSIIERRIALA